MSTPISTICPAGSFCIQGVYTPTQCSAGTYQANQGQSSCSTCPAGYYCIAGTIDFSINTCPTGYYCPSGTGSNHQYPCSQSTYNPVPGAQNSTYCISCDPGSYCSGTGLSAVSGSCSGGYYCSGSAIVPNPTDGTTGNICSAGYYCPIGGSVPIPCPGGQYCAGTGLQTSSGNCTNGYYCISLATTPNPNDSTGGPCSAGYYCPSGSVSKTPCPAGTFNTLANQYQSSACSTCTQGFYCQGIGLSAPSGSCAAGFYCPAGSVTNTSYGCAAGFACPSGSYQQTACTAGYYQPNKLQSTCLQCPAGYYCDASTLAAQKTPVICPAGYYCPAGTSSSTQHPCSPGTYNPALGRSLSSACLGCPAGQYCNSNPPSSITGSCTQGYYCTQNSSSPTQNICSAGFYCPAASSIQIPCSAGHYCDISGLYQPAGLCQAGYYCTLQATTSAPTSVGQGGGTCSPGYYCPLGSSTQTPCPIGTFNSASLQSSSTSCSNCTAGYYCSLLAATGTTGGCKAGFYCVTGSVTPTPNSGISPVGSYCPILSSSPLSCPAGTYGPVQGLSSCLTCPPGFTCEGGAASPVQCQAGFYCTGGNSLATATPCSSGYYNGYLGQTSCLPCPIGSICLQTIVGGVTTGATLASDCPVGSYCPEGLNNIVCPSGTYSLLNNLQVVTNCNPCPAGSYCLNGAIAANCTAGYFCVAGNSSPNPNGLSSNSVVGMLCPTGYFCIVGTTSALITPCDTGKFTTSPGASVSTNCTDCTPGYYCIPGDPNPYICPLGAYCPEASQSPTSCGKYSYSAVMMANSSSTCQPCPAGYLCTSTSIGDLTRFPCPYGSYCPFNATEPVPCPAGTWGPTYSLASASQCYACPSGSYCPYVGGATLILCDDWKWCPERSSQQLDCPAGYYCHENTKTLSPCFGGYYCPTNNFAAISPPYRCQPGYYCPPGSAEPTVCPPGSVYVVNSLRVLEVDSCVYCPAGTYSKVDQCLDCYAGYVCLEGASRPDPRVQAVDGGYPCPSGFYCPAASGQGSPCPVGYYYANTGAKQLSDCIPCPSNYFVDLEGQAGCYSCGAFATSAIGSTTCLCIGKNRAFMKLDFTCRCIPGYSYYNTSGTVESDQSSTADCVPTVLPICKTDEVRDSATGKCVSTSNSCFKQCGKDGGTMDLNTGSCSCTNHPSANDVCDSACQASSATCKLDSSGNVVITSPNNYTTTTVDFQSSAGYAGRIYCFAGYNCQIRTLNSDSSSGAFTSNLQCHEFITGTGSRRLASANNLINPVVCLQYGDTMFFSVVSNTQYPIYLKNSLLNSNPNFDYSAFLELQTLINNGQNITSFGYTFVDPGTYVFANNADNSQYTIISVMTQTGKCPSPAIRERSAGTVTRSGVTQSKNINVESDWQTFFFLVCVFILFIIVVTIVNVFKRKNLKKAMKKNLESYRKMLTNHASLIKLENEERAAALSSGKDSEGASGGTSINPQIFEEIYRKLGDISNLLKERANLQKNLESDYVISVGQSLKEMKNVINNLLNPTINDSPKVDFTPGEGRISLIINPSSEPETQKLINKISKDSNLTDKAKQELLDELSNNFASLEAQLAEDRVQAANTLKNRIDQRNKARRELLLKKQKLEEQERNLREEMQREIKDTESISQQCDKDYEKDKRRAREKVFGNVAKNMRKDLLEKIRRNPELEENLLAQYENEMSSLEKTLDDDKGQQHRDLLKRLQQRKEQRIRDAQMRAEKVTKDYKDVNNELERINKQIDLSIAIEAETQVEVALPKEIDLTEADEKNIDRKFKEIIKNSDNSHESKLSQLEKQKQKLSNKLNADTSTNERENILEEMRRVDQALQNTMNDREADQRKILAERLKERRRLRKEKQEKGAENVVEFNANTLKLAEDDKLKRLQEIVNNLPENEKLLAIKQMLSDKHDQELIDLQSKQQKRAAFLHSKILREALDNKTEATRLAPEYLSSMKELQQKQTISTILLETEKEAEKEFQKQ